MNLEQQIKATRRHFEYNKNEQDFKERVFQSLINEEPINKKRKSSKKLVFLITLPLIIIPTLGFAYTSYMKYTFQWNNATIQMNDFTPTGKQKLEPPPAPLDVQFKDVKHIEYLQHLTLAESRKIVPIPLRDAQEVDGWKRVDAVGLVTSRTDSNGKIIPVTADNVFGDSFGYNSLFRNNKGQQIWVTQRYDQVMTETLQGKRKTVIGAAFGGAYTLKGFGSDLAVLRPLPYREGIEYQDIILWIKGPNNVITDIDILTDADSAAAESFAHAFLKAPTT